MCKKDPAKFFFSPEKDLRDYYPLCGLVLLEGNVKQDGLICPENRASLLTFPLFSCSLNLSSRATATVWLPAPSAALPPQLGSSQITWLVQSQPRYCSLSTSFLSVRPPRCPLFTLLSYASFYEGKCVTRDSTLFSPWTDSLGAGERE